MNTTNRDGVSVPLALPAADKLSGNPIADGFDARWNNGRPAKAPPVDHSITRTDIPPARAPAPELPAYVDPTPAYSHNQLSAAEVERTVADLRSHGVSEDKIKEALGSEYTAPAGQSGSSVAPVYDLNWQDIPDARGLKPGSLAGINEGLSKAFAAIGVPVDAAASLAKAMFRARAEYLNLSTDAARTLHQRTEEFRLNEAAPGTLAKAQAAIAAARKVNPEWLNGMEQQGMLSSRFVLAALARFGKP
jgi:hypothetical protein